MHTAQLTLNKIVIVLVKNNNLKSIAGPPNYETLAGIQTIYNPHHITIKNQNVGDVDSPPPNYEDIDLSR